MVQLIFRVARLPLNQVYRSWSINRIVLLTIEDMGMVSIVSLGYLQSKTGEK